MSPLESNEEFFSHAGDMARDPRERTRILHEVRGCVELENMICILRERYAKGEYGYDI